MRAAHCSRISCSCPIWIRQRPNRSLQATSAWYARVWPMRNSSSSRTGSCCLQNARRNWMRLCITANSVRNGSASSESKRLPAPSPRASARIKRTLRARRNSPKPICSRRWSGNSRNCKASWGSITRGSTLSLKRWRARAEHYQPRFSGDTLPSTLAGVAVALADKLETLVGLFGIGQCPTSDKDPFALRRAALGLLRILLEKALPLDLEALLRLSFEQFGAVPSVNDPTEPLLDFFYDRLRILLRERGHRADEIEAVLSTRPMRLDDLSIRLDAVHAFNVLPDAAALAAAHKRIANILKKSADTAHAEVQPALLQEAAEQKLFAHLTKLTPALRAHFAAREYIAALTLLATLRAPVDAFFEQVMVNTENAAICANRIALLKALYAQMNGIADVSKLASAG